MGVPGAIQVTLRGSSQDATVASWSLPAFIVPIKSVSVVMAMGDDDLVFIRRRVANALNIQDNDTVDFLINDISETWRLKVKVREDRILTSDILIHDLISLGLADSVQSGTSAIVTLTSGTLLRIPEQEMWAGMRVIEKKGGAILYFDGASRNNPHGPCGCGFHIVTDCTNNKLDLVQGSRFSGMDQSSNQMEYEGLIEGLVWALRLDLKRLSIVGDSELIIKQLTGEYAINNPQLVVLYEKVQELLSRHADLEVSYQHIPREENRVADSLANQAIATRSNVTACNWSNINQLMRVDMNRRLY